MRETKAVRDATSLSHQETEDKATLRDRFSNQCRHVDIHQKHVVNFVWHFRRLS